ncbi:MAG TPA: phage holin family protein [Gaiellaceae bacterium]|nr:phage holin family protein [Gaiellaceae bacterium]
MPGLKLNGVTIAAKELVDRARSVVRLEIELALMEIKRKLIRVALGVGLGAAAALFALFAVGFLMAGAAAGIATALPVWAALLIVGGVLLLGALVLAMLGLRSIKAGTPPVPDEAIEEARLTTETIRANGR